MSFKSFQIIINKKMILIYSLVFQITNLMISFILGNWADRDIKYFRQGYQTWSYLLSNDGSFDDFYGDRFEKLGDYFHWKEYTQGPITNVIGKIFYFLPTESAIVIFVIFNLITIILLVNSLTKKNKNLNILIILINYPLFFAIFRGNNDIYILPSLLFIMYLLKTKRYKSMLYFSGILIGLEPILILFGLTLLLSPKWKYFLIYFSGVSSALILPLFYGTNNLAEYYRIARNFTDEYYLPTMIINNGGLLFNNSLFGVTKFLYFKSNQIENLNTGQVAEKVAKELIHPYYYLAILIGFLILILIFLIKSHLDRLTLLVTVMVLLPYVAATYKLVMFTFLIFLYLNFSSFGIKRNVYTLLLLNLILIPKNYIWIQFPFDPIGMTSESIANPLLMILLILNIYFNSQKSIRNSNLSNIFRTTWHKWMRVPTI